MGIWSIKTVGTKELVLELNGSKAIIPFDKEKLIRVTINYIDSSSKSVWLGSQDIVDNIRMKGEGFSFGNGEVQFL